MKMPIYPLLQVLHVKIRRVEQQEKVVKEKQAILDEEEKKLKAKEEARDKVLNHHDDKLRQLRAELDQITTSEVIKQMKLYLKEVKIKLEIEEKKVIEQKAKVDLAKKDLEQAKEELKKRRVDVDKIKTHQEDWKKEMQKEMQIWAGKEEDELGQIIFAKNKRIKY